MPDFTPAHIAEQLQTMALFKGVSSSDLLALISIMKPLSFTAGTVLFEQGTPGDTLYVILSGQVRVFTRDPDGNPITLSIHGPGHVVGDFALLDGEPRSASAAAVDNLDVIALNRADFFSFLPDHISIGLAMLRNLTDRVRYITIYRNKISDFGQQVIAGEYERAIQEFSQDGPDDSDIKGMISAFAQLAHSFQARHNASSS